MGADTFPGSGDNGSGCGVGPGQLRGEFKMSMTEYIKHGIGIAIGILILSLFLAMISMQTNIKGKLKPWMEKEWKK